MRFLENFIALKEQAFTSQMCSTLIEVFESNSKYHYEGNVLGTSSFERSDNKRCKELSLLDLPGFESKYQILLQFFEKHFKEYINTYESSSSLYSYKLGIEELRIKKYEDGDYFKPHVDSAKDYGSRRHLAGIMYLNTCTTGETVFCRAQTIIHPAAGLLVIFPTYWPWIHEGAIVKKEKKYILNTFLRCE